MTTGRIWTALLSAVALVTMPAAAGYAQDAAGKKKGGRKAGEVVDVATLPADIVDAVKKALPDCKIDSGTKKTNKKGDSYTLTLSKDGKTCEADLAPGKNGGYQGELIETVDAATLPKRITKAVDEEAPGGKITKAEKVTRIPDGGSHYRIEIDASGTSKTVTLSEKGKVIPPPGERKKKDAGAAAGATPPAAGDAGTVKKDAGAAAGATPPVAGDAGTDKKDGAVAPPPTEKKE
jgi:hypothetical protein